MLSMKELGELIAKKRKSLGLTQDALAEKLGITPQAVSKWENGVGYPDITLFPQIAEIFNMTTDELFGIAPIKNEEEKVEKTEEPEELEELEDLEDDLEGEEEPKISVNVDFDDDNSPVITVNSLGQKFKKMFKNFKFDMNVDESDNEPKVSGAVREDLAEFENVDLDIRGAVDVNLLKSDAPMIEIEGTKKFFSHLSYSVEGNTLRVKVEPYSSCNEENVIDIYCGFVKGNNLTCISHGASDIKSEVDFETATASLSGSGDFDSESFGNIEVKVSGSGDITFKNADVAKVSVAGSGDTSIGEVRTSFEATVAGSGDIDVKKSNNTKVSVSGSSDLHIGEASGDLSFKASGSCDATVSGKVDELYISLTAACDFNGKDLTAQNATVIATGPSSIKLGGVSGKLTKNVSNFTDFTIK